MRIPGVTNPTTQSLPPLTGQLHALESKDDDWRTDRAAREVQNVNASCSHCQPPQNDGNKSSPMDLMLGQSGKKEKPSLKGLASTQEDDLDWAVRNDIFDLHFLICSSKPKKFTSKNICETWKERRTFLPWI